MVKDAGIEIQVVGYLIFIIALYSFLLLYNWWWWSRSVVSNSLQPREGTVAYQAPLSVRFSRQEYWSGLLFPSPIIA